MSHPTPPLLTAPNEILCQIASYLPISAAISLQQSCHALHSPLRPLLIFKHKNDILLFAAQRNNVDLLTAALSAGADVSYCVHWLDESATHSNDTALHCAAAGGYTSIITELLHHNPPLEVVGGKGETPLHTAAWRGHQAVVDLLLAAGCDPTVLRHGKESLLLAAITSNLEPTARAYIGQMDVDSLSAAIELKRLSITRLMFARGIARTVSPPLHLAAAAGLEYVKLCITHGASINAPDGPRTTSAISAAASIGDIDVVEYLVRKGASLTIGPKKHWPIMLAVYRADTAMVRLLLLHGAKLTGLVTAQANVLEAACVNSPPAVVKLLLDAGQGLQVDGNGWDERKPSPLHIAALNGNAAVIKFLIRRGAKVDQMRGLCRETALHWAARTGQVEAVEALLEGGANPRLKSNETTALLMASRSKARQERRGQTMAALVRGGADITELGARSRSVVNSILADELQDQLSLAGREAKH